MKYNEQFFLARMNRFAPTGFKFVAVGPNRNIALYSSKIMGDVPPRGAFVSDISFDMIDDVYGHLLNHNRSHDVLGAQMVRPVRLSETEHLKELGYMSVLDRVDKYLLLNRGPMLNKRAIVIQSMMDVNVSVPRFLNQGMRTSVEKSVWYAVKQVMGSVNATEMNALGKMYAKSAEKMTGLGIVKGSKSKTTTTQDYINAEKLKKLTATYEYFQYDVMPEVKQLEQELGIDTAIEPELFPREISMQVLQEILANLKSEMDECNLKLGNDVVFRPAVEQMNYMLSRQPGLGKISSQISKTSRPGQGGTTTTPEPGWFQQILFYARLAMTPVKTR